MSSSALAPLSWPASGIRWIGGDDKVGNGIRWIGGDDKGMCATPFDLLPPPFFLPFSHPFLPRFAVTRTPPLFSLPRAVSSIRGFVSWPLL